MLRPFGMLAELTYACPLHFPYCSNPLNLAHYSDELTTAEWQRVFAEARDLGVLQLHLSGDEPLLRRDLVELVASAHEPGMYTNLITSGIGLTQRPAEQLRDAGLDHVQISIQADESALSDLIASTPSFERKIAAARLVKELGWPLTLERRPSGNGVDAGTLPQLRSPHGRFRRVPLPGVSPHRRRSAHRSGLPPLPCIHRAWGTSPELAPCALDSVGLRVLGWLIAIDRRHNRALCRARSRLSRRDARADRAGRIWPLPCGPQPLGQRAG